MAERAGVSGSTVGRIWRTFGLQPHVVASFKISRRAVHRAGHVGLYLNPPDRATGVLSSADGCAQLKPSNLSAADP